MHEMHEIEVDERGNEWIATSDIDIMQSFVSHLRERIEEIEDEMWMIEAEAQDKCHRLRWRKRDILHRIETLESRINNKE